MHRAAKHRITTTLLLCLWLVAVLAPLAVARDDSPKVDTAASVDDASARLPTSVLPTVPGYAETERLSSPHATQAAAADEEKLYAISNTTVATYDRKSGKLLATTSAEGTEHLNSGFLHEGRIYAAHSNYPETPHESDIRVFDPQANTLEIHHVFPDPPGSLVWCLRHDGHWWCCFAWYGDENSQTVLIEYADDSFTREHRRFFFPPAVIADFDGMSASGGIWDGDTLLASHHHYPVLYRLRLPSDPEATTLELVETLSCPFPGQGIAADPATPGGLSGIDRPARAIVTARPLTPPCCRSTPGSRRSLILQGSLPQSAEKPSPAAQP